MSEESGSETYSVGRVARLAGVTPDLLRAWERRYGAVEPLRTPGGTRRYSASDIERLRLLKAAVDAGNRIGDVATLSNDDLRGRAKEVEPESAVGSTRLEPVIEALAQLDSLEAERLITAQLSILGPVRFAKEFALPLLVEIGIRWADQRLCVASEHLGSSLLRSLLGSALKPTASHRDAPRVVFGTLPGERHEIGLLIAALTALGAGANPLYLGANLPAAELVRAVEMVGARAVALSVVIGDPTETGRELVLLRESVPPDVEIWVGGSGAGLLDWVEGVSSIPDMERLEERVELLRI